MKDSIDSALRRLAGFSPRREVPVALEVTVDGQPVRFTINRETLRVSPPEQGAWSWVSEFTDWLEFEKYMQNRRYQVRELMAAA